MITYEEATAALLRKLADDLLAGTAKLKSLDYSRETAPGLSDDGRWMAHAWTGFEELKLRVDCGIAQAALAGDVPPSPL